MDNNQALYNDFNKWNWGAFGLGWIWGVGNNCYLALLQFVPIPLMAIVIRIILGIYGTRWAYENGEIKDVNTFFAIQNSWNKAGKIYFFIEIAIFVLMIVIEVVLFASIYSLLSRQNAFF